MPYEHGVQITDTTDPGSPNVSISANGIVFVMGCATGATPGVCVTTVQKVTSFEGYKEVFGWAGTDDDTPDTDYTLEEFAYIFFRKYKNAPCYMVNVFTSAEHTTVDTVDAADFVAIVDDIDQVFPEWGQVPSLFLCPEYSEDSSLQTAMEGKIDYHDGQFKLMCLYDGVETATAAETVIEAALITADNTRLCFPKYGGFNLSSIVAACTVLATREHDDIPYFGPSNYNSTDLGHAIPFDIAVADKKLSGSDIKDINEAGVITWNSFGVGGKTLWGPQMTSYVDGVADYTNNTYIPRAMANYSRTIVVLNTVAHVDDPTNIVLVQSVVAKLNAIGGALQAKGAYLGFKVLFLSADNPTINLAAGIIKFRLQYLAPIEASVIEIDLEVNLAYFDTLFA